MSQAIRQAVSEDEQLLAMYETSIDRWITDLEALLDYRLDFRQTALRKIAAGEGFYELIRISVARVYIPADVSREDVLREVLADLLNARLVTVHLGSRGKKYLLTELGRERLSYVSAS